MIPELVSGLSVESITELVRSWGAWGVAVIIGLMIVHSFIPFPAEVVAIAAGMCYGAFWGMVVTWAGAMLGACLAFCLARWLGRPFVVNMLGEESLRTLDHWTEKEGAGTLLLGRFIPLIAFNLINYAAGLTTRSWWTFVWVTGVGILPLTVLMVVLGDQLTHLPLWIWAVVAGGIILSWFGMRCAMSGISSTRRY